MEALAAVETVDFVVLNNYPDSINIIKKIKPNFYCKGPDYNSLENNKTSTINNNNNFIEEKKICKKIGCQIKRKMQGAIIFVVVRWWIIRDALERAMQ